MPPPDDVDTANPVERFQPFFGRENMQAGCGGRRLRFSRPADDTGTII
jgi:hypothetical protein